MATHSHPNCRTEQGHICQEPSGRACIEDGCDAPAGTLWGPHWCPDHDLERLDRVSAQLADTAAALDRAHNEGTRADA